MGLLRSRSFPAPLIVACVLAAGGVGGKRAAWSELSAAQPSLEMVVGDYQAATQIIQIRLREDGVLTIAVPGQPVRELEPLGNYRFAQKGLTGYIEFVRDRPERVNAFMALQPGGGFRAARMGRPDTWTPQGASLRLAHRLAAITSAAAVVQAASARVRGARVPHVDRRGV